MENLPLVIKDIVIDYLYQLEHTDKLSKSLDIIKNIKYEIYENEFGYNESFNGKTLYTNVESSIGEDPKRIINYNVYINWCKLLK